MRKFLIALLLLVGAGVALADDTYQLVYEGTWVTTNRKLNGTMTATITEVSENKWKGTFAGVWEGQKFSYNVEFSGPPDNLTGKATIDGASYQWTGKMSPTSPGKFDGTFDGSRYKGYFNLKQK
jgi:flavodoxin